MAHSRHGSKDDIHRTPDVSHIRNEGVAHEGSDVDPKGIAIFVGGLLVFIIISMVLMGMLERFMGEQASKMEKERAPSQLVIESYQNQIPPGPKLQEAPGWGATLDNGQFVPLTELNPPDQERVVLFNNWRQQLETGGSVDPKNNFTTLPIEEAMKQTVAQGLPARQAQQGDQKMDVSGPDMPMDSSSGRQTEKRDR
jgi:hypothetical protein